MVLTMANGILAWFHYWIGCQEFAMLGPSLCLTPPATPCAPPILPSMPLVPKVPCMDNPACTFIMDAIDLVYPHSTQHLIDNPGTCQNWSHEWLCTAKDIMEFSVEQICQHFDKNHTGMNKRCVSSWFCSHPVGPYPWDQEWMTNSYQDRPLPHLTIAQ